jgi:hypothetical protein
VALICAGNDPMRLYARSMKLFLCKQFKPTKTMKQLISDRNVYRLLIVAELVLVWCA